MPRRRGSLWLPLDVNFFEDDRIMEAGEKATYLYLAMCLASKRLGTDGLLTPRQIAKLAIPGTRTRLQKLISLELVHNFDRLYGVAGWGKHNDPMVLVAERRERDNLRKKGQALPTGILPESRPTPRVEKRREEKRREDWPHGPCPGCAEPDCPSPRALRVVDGGVA